MRKELKDQLIDRLCEEIKAYPLIYIADIGGLNSVQTSKLRRAAFRKEVKTRDAVIRHQDDTDTLSKW